MVDWQHFLSTCPTARKTPYLSSFAVDNQQEISPQSYWSLTIVGYLVLTEAVNHIQNLTIAWQRESYVRLLVTLSCKYSIVYAYTILAHMHACVVSKIYTCSTSVSTLVGLKLFPSSSPHPVLPSACIPPPGSVVLLLLCFFGCCMSDTELPLNPTDSQQRLLCQSSTLWKTCFLSAAQRSSAVNEVADFQSQEWPCLLAMESRGICVHQESAVQWGDSLGQRSEK